jgi:HEPN domain-containing protein
LSTFLTVKPLPEFQVKGYYCGRVYVDHLGAIIMLPKNQEKLFDISYASELLNIAKGDLQTAETLCEALALGKSLRTENIFFHAHQSIEKSLKAFLIKSKKPVPFVHELGSLIAKITTFHEIPFGYELSQLDAFATIRRYEEGHVILTLEETKTVVKTASDCIKWVEAYVPI